VKTSKYRVSIILNSKASSPARVGATFLISSKAKQAKHCFQETSDEELNKTRQMVAVIHLRIHHLAVSK
jgi:hypothetical protein